MTKQKKVLQQAVVETTVKLADLKKSYEQAPKDEISKKIILTILDLRSLRARQ